MTNGTPFADTQSAIAGLGNRLPGMRRLRHLSIGQKFDIGFGILIGLVATVVGFNFLGSQQAIQDINRTGELRAPITLASTQAQANLLRMLTSVRGYLVLSDSRYQDDYYQARQAFETNLTELEALAIGQTSAGRLHLDALKTTFNRWSVLPEDLFTLHGNPRENQPGLRIARLDIQPLNALILNKTDNMIAIQEQREPTVENLALLKDMVVFRNSLKAMLAALRAYATSGDLAFKFEYTTSLTDNEAAWESLLENQVFLTDDQQAHLNNIIRSREDLLQLPFQIFAAVEGERAYEDLYLFRREAVPLGEEMLRLLEEMTSEQQSLLQSDLRQSRQKLIDTQIQTLTGGLFGFVLGIGLAFLVKVSIVGPVHRLTDTARQITAGRLYLQAKIESYDEIGQLAMALNTMTGRLRETISGLEKRNRQLEGLGQTSLSLTSHLTLQTVLEAILAGTLKLLSEAQHAHIFLYENGHLTSGAARVVHGQREQILTKAHLYDLASIIARQGELLIVPDTSQYVLNGEQLTIREGAIVGLPLEIGDRVVGVMTVDKGSAAAWPDSELEVLGLLADQAAVAIENAQLFEQAQRDIRERRQAEAALKAYRDRLEELVKARTAELTESNRQLELEISERKRAEEQLKASLQEKEVLLKEIHHRVKNNMQIISSLLDLQANTIQDERVRDLFQGSQQRIRSMALIHEQLYQSSDLARIDFAEYIENLTDRLLYSYGVRAGNITLQLDLTPLFLSVETAIPCGLIINELVSNALKHAFPNSRFGQISITLQRVQAQQLSLQIKDNGVGFPAEIDFRRTASLGLTLVNTLVKQIKGTIDLYSEDGTQFKITFSDLTAKIRD